MRRAMSVEGALDLVAAREWQGPGSQNRAERSSTSYPSMSADMETGGQIAARDRKTATASIRPPRGLTTESANQSTVFDDIALAHREIYALYEIAQAMGSSLGVADTMALISSKLSNLVPFSTCALFLRIDDGGALRCRMRDWRRGRDDSAVHHSRRTGLDGVGSPGTAGRWSTADRAPTSTRPVTREHPPF